MEGHGGCGCGGGEGVGGRAICSLAVAGRVCGADWSVRAGYGAGRGHEVGGLGDDPESRTSLEKREQ